MAYIINAPEGEVTIKVSATERRVFKNEEVVAEDEVTNRLAEVFPAIFIQVDDGELPTEDGFAPEYTDEQITAAIAELKEEDTPGEEVPAEEPAAAAEEQTNEGDIE